MPRIMSSERTALRKWSQTLQTVLNSWTARDPGIVCLIVTWAAARFSRRFGYLGECGCPFRVRNLITTFIIVIDVLGRFVWWLASTERSREFSSNFTNYLFLRSTREYPFFTIFHAKTSRNHQKSSPHLYFALGWSWEAVGSAGSRPGRWRLDLKIWNTQAAVWWP